MLKLTNLQAGVMTPIAARLTNPLALAFVGDSVFDLYVRTVLLERQLNSHRLHVEAIGFVSARAQSAAFGRLEDKLTQDEMYIFRRGRNAKPTTVPKNAHIKDYRAATGLETLVGYLYLSGQLERLDEIMELILTISLQEEKTDGE